MKNSSIYSRSSETKEKKNGRFPMNRSELITNIKTNETENQKFKQISQRSSGAPSVGKMGAQSSATKKTNFENYAQAAESDSQKTYYKFKFIMLGDISVGKTCIALKFVNNEFHDKYVCTVGVEFKLKTLNLSSKISTDLQIWDTCGQERFRTITRQYYRDANGILLVFDLTSSQSFNEIEVWLDEIRSNIQSNLNEIMIVLVGNKCDLLTERQVSYSEASNFAKKHEIDYIEVSAKDGTNIYEAFENMTWAVIHKEEASPKSKFNVVNRSERSIVIKDYSKSKKRNCC